MLSEDYTFRESNRGKEGAQPSSIWVRRGELTISWGNGEEMRPLALRDHLGRSTKRAFHPMERNSFWAGRKNQQKILDNRRSQVASFKDSRTPKKRRHPLGPSGGNSQ